MEQWIGRRDPTDGRRPARQPLLQQPAPSRPLPLRACLLSGGESRRMGRDKALLPHPDGGTWLERTLQLLKQLEVSITLLSRQPTQQPRSPPWPSRRPGKVPCWPCTG